jgi:hypothetical protein
MANSKRRCRFCKEYSPAEEGVIIKGGFYCDMEHAIAYANGNLQAAGKKNNAFKKQEFRNNDKATRRNAAVKACHAYIKRRDKGKPCISCGHSFGDIKFSAGHFITAGSNLSLRFDERNIFGQCWWNCNKNRSGNITEFRKGLVERHGQELLGFLEGEHDLIKDSIEFFRKVEQHYKDKDKMLEDGIITTSQAWKNPLNIADLADKK